MAEVGMDVAAARQMAATLQSQSAQVNSILSSVDRQIAHLDAVWSGADADGVVALWRGNYRAAFRSCVQVLDDMTHSLRANAEQQEVVSQAAGNAGRSISAEERAMQSPRTLHNMLESINTLYAHHQDFAIQKVVGPDGKIRYVVLITGIHGLVDSPDGHDLPMSAEEELLHTGAVENQIRAALRAEGVPQGADVAIVGHSQGGIVAMDLSENTSFRQQYHLTNVITFGSPVSSQWDEVSRSDTANYLRVTDIEDPVPRADLLNPRSPDFVLKYSPVGIPLELEADGAHLISNLFDGQLLGARDSVEGSGGFHWDPLDNHAVSSYERLLNSESSNSKVNGYEASLVPYSNGQVVSSSVYQWQPTTQSLGIDSDLD